MAQIVCVISYKKRPGTKKLQAVQEIHVMALDKNDKLCWITADPELALQFEEDFSPLHLKKGDLAPIEHVGKAQLPAKKIDQKRVPKFEIYYHGPQAKFKCGYMTHEGFEPTVHGVPSPDGH